MFISVELKSIYDDEVMKIVHITLHYNDGWGYQDNLMPAYQRKQGDNVTVLTENAHLQKNNNGKFVDEIIKKGSEYEIDGVKIVKFKCFLNTTNTSLFCSGLYNRLKSEKPDMIFHHGVVGCTLLVAARYKRKHPEIKLYVDNHADWINKSKNHLWHLLYEKLYLSMIVKAVGNTVDLYLGVSPLRCSYLHQTFHVHDSRIGFLPLGCDINMSESINEKKEEIRSLYQIPQDAFVIVSGGKMDRSKGTLTLIQSCKNLIKSGKNVHLLLFGKADDEVKQAAENNRGVTLIGWCDRKKTFMMLKMADVACWPLLHTTLIEDSVACGLPLVIKSSGNVGHFKYAQNGVFLETGDLQELTIALLNVLDNIEKYSSAATNVRNQYGYDSLVQGLNEGRIEKDYHKYLE